MTCRRSFLLGAAALLADAGRRAVAGASADLYLPPPGVSSRDDLYLPGSPAPGLPAAPDLVEEVDAMLAVEEGSGTPRIRILFEFGCPRSPELYLRIRPVLEKARFDWIPIPSVQAGDDAPAAALFAPGASAETLKSVFEGRRPADVDAAAARAQGRLFAQTIGPRLYVETNRPFATPTLVYRGRDFESRVIRGAPDLGALRSILAAAV